GPRRGGVARSRGRPARRAHRARRGVLAPGVRRRAHGLARARRTRGARPPRGRGPDVGAVRPPPRRPPPPPARPPRPVPARRAAPAGLARRPAAVRSWVLPGLLPVDRRDGPLDELVASGRDALAGGETGRGPAARPVPGRPVPGPPAVEGGRAAGPHTAMHVKERGVGHVGPGGDTALAAARLLAERDAEAVCRAAEIGRAHV